MAAMGLQLDSSDLHGDEPQYLQYRSLSLLAVASFLLSLLGLSAFLFAALVVLAGATFVVSLCALRRVRRRASELTGAALACAALVVSGVSVVGASAMHIYFYMTEVPPGHVRISFSELQPDPHHPELPVPPSALELDGKKVFVKGYVYPDGQKSNIKRFILVPDMGTCCFGGQPKLTDMIEVTLQDPLRVRYSLQRRKLAGVLHVSPLKKPVSGVDGVYYQLDAHYLK